MREYLFNPRHARLTNALGHSASMLVSAVKATNEHARNPGSDLKKLYRKKLQQEEKYDFLRGNLMFAGGSVLSAAILGLINV